ncbi:MAG: EscU/YscU/HrcU family type III secretion system export apparatus switch protein, partial [Rickettsiales bacterium]
MADEEKANKTEQPSQKRLDEAREKGNLANSKELGSFLMLVVLAITVAWFIPNIMRDVQTLFATLLSDSDSMITDKKGLSIIMYKIAFTSFAIISMPLAAAIIAGIATSFLQHGFVLSAESIKPKFSKISPIAGLGRIFSIRSLVDFI